MERSDDGGAPDMLILTRYPGQAIRLAPHPELDPATPIGELFRDGPIRIYIVGIAENRVRVGIEAHPRIEVVRDELPFRK